MSQHHNDDDDSNDAVYNSKAGLSSPAGEQDGVGLTASSSLSMPATPTTHSGPSATAASASASASAGASAGASASASASAVFATQFFSSVRHQQRVLAQQQLVNAPRVGQWRMKDRVTNERGEESRKKAKETGEIWRKRETQFSSLCLALRLISYSLFDFTFSSRVFFFSFFLFPLYLFLLFSLADENCQCVVGAVSEPRH
jgi:hypothetical protein